MFTITNKVLADIIGKESTDDRVFWQPEDLPQIKITLRALQIGNKSETFLIDASMPYWLYLSIIQSQTRSAVRSAEKSGLLTTATKNVLASLFHQA